MSTATTTFLQSANAANAAEIASGATPATPVDRAQVLTAIDKPEVSDLLSLATELNVSPGAVKPVLDTLSSDGLVNRRNDTDLELSDSGKRALRYISMVP